MARHVLSKLDLLELALEGAQARRGLAQDLTDEEWAMLDRDVAEIQRRIELGESTEAKRLL